MLYPHLSLSKSHHVATSTRNPQHTNSRSLSVVCITLHPVAVTLWPLQHQHQQQFEQKNNVVTIDIGFVPFRSRKREREILLRYNETVRERESLLPRQREISRERVCVRVWRWDPRQSDHGNNNNDSVPRRRRIRRRKKLKTFFDKLSIHRSSRNCEF